ncbi:hypothetical protein HKX69_10160 [Streptomyces argyrophyllae]|uniref:Uncharacterized protein n=1 Tax=Streptomyces argyrophylli TaxID=2726118 RepID=A0A6M4PH13_9ACTN|nr:hypothetical protein [Streptomyces argyrophyllae]QJS09837.1 hypothetical protein HKX69_10160 [Streptomyces argyrophyllae]
MATKTAEGATGGTEAGTGARKDDETTTAGPAAEQSAENQAVEEQDAENQAAGDPAAENQGAEEAAEAAGGEAGDATEAAGGKTPSGVGQGAGAVVSAALGLVSLSGGWIGTVASAREQLVGQLQTSSTASVARQIKEVYGDAWHATALWAGLFALAALITGVVVLARPAFGTPGRPQAAWIKSVAWAGVSLGVIGLLLAVLKYSDALLGLPSTG